MTAAVDLGPHKDRPILFSGPMVRAILDGRKTQTRRVVKSQPRDGWAPIVGPYHPTVTDKDGVQQPGPLVYGASDEDEGRKCLYGHPGDRLWVRETWRLGDHNDAAAGCVHYRADQDEPAAPGQWKPSIHMPRWASRLTLEVKAVRVGRLQEISEADAKAEGMTAKHMQLGTKSCHSAFVDLWDDINSKRPGCSWSDNPWVWVVELERVTPPAPSP